MAGLLRNVDYTPRGQLEAAVVGRVYQPRLGQSPPKEGQLAQADGPGFTLHPAGATSDGYLSTMVQGSYSSSAEDGLHAGATAAPCAHRRGMCGRDWRAHATKLRLAMCMTAEARDGMRRGTGSYLCIQTNTCDAAPMAATLRLATTPRAPPVPAPKCHSMHRSTICTSSPHASWASTFRSM